MIDDLERSRAAGERQALLASVAEAAHEWTGEHPEWGGFEESSHQSHAEAERSVHVSAEAEEAFVAAIGRRGWRSTPGHLGWSRMAVDDRFAGGGEAPAVDHSEVDDV
ncbi:hypothetical protein [Blastococcus sp. DSM 46786]|uniref:hypothetical protein n=1 Tax=Blastococcus sp. DSM 46786 TaxID=1798227 RepID=UPI00147D78C1|nr:hypothetical protein [Blastococcus sp. DSM 46786]